MTQQKEAVDEVTGDLNQQREKAPEELVPSVEQLTATLRAVKDPGTSPQERDGVIRTAQSLSSTLDVIGDPGTPPALRRQLTGLVKQVTATLDASSHAGTSPEQRRAYTLVAERSAAVLNMIGDRRTPQGLLRPLRVSVDNANSAAQAGSQGATQLALSMAVSMGIISDPNTSDKERKELATTTSEAGSSPGRGDDPDKQIDRMKKKQEEAVSAQGLPDAPLPEAAKVCTNAVFDSVPDDTLNNDLKNVIPEKWETEGVNDFWKSDEAGNESLNVLVQLQNEESTDALLEIRRLIPKLADSLPASQLFGTLGTPGLDCLRAAQQLDQKFGVESGSWVRMAKEKE
ncbi:hypothetical protein [Streptomyces sp. NPDC059378]|uniref:hypothetical protein n=1 Tax=Streptomyces sp. NPDC059378 TaxID=3346815 RepID=UPI00368F7A36